MALALAFGSLGISPVEILRALLGLATDNVTG